MPRTALGHMVAAVLLAVVVVEVVAWPSNSRGEAPIRIAAAASFRQALDEIVRAYEQRYGQPALVTYGVTGNLVRQILLGAPFDVFLAADEASTARLVASGQTNGTAEVLVQGRISFIVPRSSKLEAGADLSGVRSALEAGLINRFAIANPELAPYGRAAKEALGKLGLLDLAAPRFVYGENVGQVAQFVASGAADAGITAHSLIIAEPLASGLKATELSLELHAPIKQTFVVLKGAAPQALSFAGFLRDGQARAIFDRHGFARP